MSSNFVDGLLADISNFPRSHTEQVTDQVAFVEEFGRRGSVLNRLLESVVDLLPQTGSSEPEGNIEANNSLLYYQVIRDEETGTPTSITTWVNTEVGSKTGWLQPE